MELNEALSAFLVQLRADGRSEHTAKQYARHARALARWATAEGLSTNIEHFTPELIARFFVSPAARTRPDGGTKKAATTNALRTSIRCLFSFLHAAGHVQANPARLVRRARCSPAPPRFLHLDERTRLLEVFAAVAGPKAERDRMLVDLLLNTGIRIGSALALDVGDLDIAHAEVNLRRTKNDRPSTAVLPVELATRLQEFIGSRVDGPLFQAGGRRVSMRHAQRRLAGWFAAAGIKSRSAHALRHSYATALLARTGDLRLVQAALNHASIASTTVYAQVDRAKLRAAVGG